MQSRWFWKHWSLDYRAIWLGLVGLFIVAFLFLWIGYLRGPSAVISWETFQHQTTHETISHTFEVGNFEFAVPIESYLTFEYFNGGPVQPNTTASYLFLFGLIVCSLVILCVITTLDRFWYVVGIGLFVLFMVSLRLEVLSLFDLSGRTLPIVVIAVYVVASFLFNTLWPTTAFLLRLIIFSGMTIVLGLLIYFFSGVPYPFLHLATTGYLPALILSVIFILMVAHEIMASFVYVVSAGTASTKSLQHFMIITIVYLVNLVLAYLHEARLIEWNFLYINLYLLLSVSAVLGIWGFRHRENLYGNIVAFAPFGAFIIVCLGAITFLTTGMLLGNHNDPALRIIRDVIIFSHIGYSIIFFIYTVSNFMVMMAENLSAYKVLYKPTRMPYFTFRFAGLIATMAFVFYSNWREYVYHGMSGFYNHIGDLYALMDKGTLAEAYYTQGRSHGFQNNRSNYILGLLEANRNDFKKAHFHYELANGRRPTEYSLINDGNLYLMEGKYFEGIDLLRDARDKFPSSAIIENNLGYAYSKIHKLDSALIFFDKARSNAVSEPLAESNFMAMVGKEYVPVKADSLLEKFNVSTPFAISNALAVATIQNQSFEYVIDPLKDSELDLGTATQLNNFLVNSLKRLDTATLYHVARIVSDSINADYHESLKATLAQAFYHQNNVSQALDFMSELAFISQMMQGKYSYIAGLWALEQGCPDLAIGYFDYAVMFDYKEARLYNTIALAEAGRLPDALIGADSLLKHPDENIREIGRQLKKMGTVTSSDLSSLSDLEKYQYCRYRVGVRDTILFGRVVDSVKDDNYKVAALLQMSERQFDIMNTQAAVRYLKQVGNIPITDKTLFEKVQHFELLLLASTGDLKGLSAKLEEGIEFSKERELEKLLYEALLGEASGARATVERNYAVLGRYNPFFEDGIIAAARYYKKQNENDMRAYSILAAAVHANTTSYRLWMAYINEALSVGFDGQAAEALRLAEALKNRR
jgi:hypothetical protein